MPYNESFSEALKRGYVQMPVAIRVIITINVVMFILQVFAGETLFGLFAFNPDPATALFQPWRMITYMFLHGGGIHLLFNMLWLWWMGRAVEETLGPKTFTVIYLGSGIGGALLDILLAQVFGIAFVIGASGAVFGVMVAFAMIFPTAPIMLILLPPIQARFLVAGLIALNVILLGGNDSTSQAAHLGGAGMGYLLMKWQQQGLDLGAMMNPLQRLWYRLTGPGKSRPKNRKMHSVTDAEVMEETKESELDRILEKISRDGYEGLTKAEKKILFEWSNRK